MNARSWFRLCFFGLGASALVVGTACRNNDVKPPVGASSDASAASSATAAKDARESASSRLSTFASKDDLAGYFKKLVQDEDDARARAAAERASRLEAGVDGAADAVMWGDANEDPFGAGDLGLSGIGEGGGGVGEGIGLGTIGTLGHGAGTGTGSGYGAGAGRAAASPSKAVKTDTSITNTQVAGVDEGDIVKVHGDYLVVLRRGRLFTLAIGGDSLAPVSSVDAFSPDLDPRGAWYDEMLVSKDTVCVIGYSYARGGTEIGLFDLDARGGIKYRATYHLRGSDYYSSRNYASRLLGEKLVFYSPTSINAREKDLTARFPALRKWRKGVDASAFSAVIEPTQIYRPLVPATSMTLHSVTVCSLSAPELTCTSRGVLGPPGRVFYVSEDSVYVWTTPYAPPRPRKSRSDGGLEKVEPRSYLYRLPLDGSEPAVLRASGAPIDQFSFHQTAEHLNVLVRDGGNGDAMWAAEGVTNGVALFRVPLSTFAQSADAAPNSAYTALPAVKGYSLQNRFVGDWVLYGAGSGWRGLAAAAKADRSVVAYRYASQDPKAAQSLSLEHVIDRIEPMGSDALVVGNKDADLVFSAISLRGKSAETHGQYVRKGASQGETRSHGFFYKPESDTSGVFGLPIRGGEEIGANQLVAGSAKIAFVKNDALSFKELGEVAARSGGSASDGCRASCVDWYGNARPIFLGERIFALMGYEMVEAKLDAGRLRERRRASFAPNADGARK